MQYEKLRPLSRAKAQPLLKSKDESDVCRAIIKLALFDDDGEWVLARCRQLLNDDRLAVRGCALTAIGHLARLHPKLDLSQTIPVLQALTQDAEVGGRAQDALDDIAVFRAEPLPPRREAEK